MSDRPAPKTIRVLGYKYDGSPRDEWPAQLVARRGTQLCVYVPAGTEEIVRGCRRQVMEDAFTGLFWTDRWYNVWQLERSEGILFYANVAMPCRFDGRVLRWVDLDLDVVYYADGSIAVKDEPEFEEHTALFAYPDGVVERALAARDELLCLAHSGEFPFKRSPNPCQGVRTCDSCEPQVHLNLRRGREG